VAVSPLSQLGATVPLDWLLVSTYFCNVRDLRDRRDQRAGVEAATKLQKVEGKASDRGKE